MRRVKTVQAKNSDSTPREMISGGAAHGSKSRDDDIKIEFQLLALSTAVEDLTIKPAQFALFGDVKQAQNSHAYGEKINAYQAPKGPEAEGYE